MDRGTAKRGGRAYAWLRSISIQARLRLVLIITIVLLTLALIVMLNSVVTSHEASVRYINTQLVTAIGDALKRGIDSLEEATKYPIIWVDQLANDTYAYLSAPHRYKAAMLYTDIENQSLLIFRRNQLIRLVAVFDMEGRGSYVKNTRKYQFESATPRQPLEEQNRLQEPWFVATLAAHGSACVWRYDQVELEGAYLQDREQTLLVSRAIVNIERYEPVGVILSAIDLQDTTALLRQDRIYDSQRAGLFTQDGTVLWGDLSPADARAFLLQASGQADGPGVTAMMASGGASRVMYHYLRLPGGLYCALRTPYAEVLGAVLKERLLLLIALVLGFVLVSLVINGIVHSVRRPIDGLVATCNTIVEGGDFSITIDDPYSDELSELTASLNNLTGRIAYLIHEVYEKKMELNQTQLQLLRSQVNPHFLYNTLETIRTKAFLAGQEELSEMTLLLAGVLRYGISQPEELVTVGKEVEKLKEYIRLQTLLYGSRFTFDVNIEPEILGHRMLKFILQPLVENAINHGINPLGRPGAIDILGYQEEDALILQIADNGRGIDGETLLKLRDYIDNRNNLFTSIGLKNVHRRIRLYHGDAYGIQVTSRENSGTAVLVRMPVITDFEGPRGGGMPDA